MNKYMPPNRPIGEIGKILLATGETIPNVTQTRTHPPPSPHTFNTLNMHIARY